jgi:hypothetical protein
MGDVFIGSEAVARGSLTKSDLRQPNVIRVHLGCDGCGLRCHMSTAAPRLPRRLGCGYC